MAHSTDTKIEEVGHTALLPCPFCGESDAFFERGDFVSGYVFCNSCSARGPVGEETEDDEGKALSIKAWNTRDYTADELLAAALGIKRVVEEIDGAMNHGTWRDDNGMRLKDTPEWVALYLAITDRAPATSPRSDLAGCKIALEQAWSSNREREAEIARLRKVIQSAAEEFVTIELRLRANQTERALGAVMCGQRDLADALAEGRAS